MAQNVTIAGASYPDVPSILVPKTGGGSASFVDTSDATATAAQVLQGYTAYAGGELLTGTASGGGGGVQTAQIAISGAAKVFYTDGTMTVKTAKGDVTAQAAIGSIAVTNGAASPGFTTTGVSLLLSYRSMVYVYKVTG